MFQGYVGKFFDTVFFLQINDVFSEETALNCLTGFLIPPRFDCIALNCTSIHWIPGAVMPLPGYNLTVLRPGGRCSEKPGEFVILYFWLHQSFVFLFNVNVFRFQVSFLQVASKVFSKILPSSINKMKKPSAVRKRSWHRMGPSRESHLWRGSEY